MKHLVRAGGWALGVAMAMLAGCASPPPMKISASAVGLCNSQVNINKIELSGTSPSIELEPGVGCVAPSGGTVNWKIAGNKHSFTSDGITGKQASPSGVTVTPAAGATPDTYSVTFTIGAGISLDWSYTIKLYANATPGTIYTCDPTIVNASSLPRAGDGGKLTVACKTGS